MFGPTCEANLEPYDPDVVICWHLAYNRDITGYYIYIYISITLQPIVTNINQYVTHVVCGFVWKWNRPWYTPKWKFKWKKHEKTLLKHVTIGYFSHKPTSTHQRVPNQHLEPPYHTLNDPDFGIFGNSIHQDVRSSIQENSHVGSRNDYAVTALYPRIDCHRLSVLMNTSQGP